ncbi:MAG: hypothetical protein JKY81_02285 [Colwellia sp.]|nr:hypothetical protein [Colwellia sp.]
MITSQSNRSFVEATQYSTFILENMHDGLLPENFFRDVSDFGNGDILNIKTVGEAQIQELEENEDIIYTPIETGNVTLAITDYVGDAWYITDVMRQDGAQIEQLKQARAREAIRAIQERRETQALATLNAGQTAGNVNSINGFAHRAIGSGANDTLALVDLIAMKLAFDKAEVPAGGRICIVDPVVGATLNTLYQANVNVDSNPMMQTILTSGFSRDHDYIMDLFGWTIMSSNRLPTVASETIGALSVTDGVANIFMNIADDQTKPLMSAWRQQPQVEGERNQTKRRDQFSQSARWGYGIQRSDTLGVIVTSASAIA